MMVGEATPKTILIQQFLDDNSAIKATNQAFNSPARASK